MPFHSTRKKDDEKGPTLAEVDPIARSMADPEFGNPLSHRFHITRKPVGQPHQPRHNDLLDQPVA